MINKMTSAFQKYEGGLFSKVEKADVGDPVATMKKEGVTLMCWADPFYPDSAIPDKVIEATTKAIKNGVAGHYTPPIGSIELKTALVQKIKEYNGLDVDPQRNILVTPGSDSGLFYAMLPFINKDDEVMIVDPSYPNNFQNVEIMGGKIVRVPVFVEDNYQFKIEEFEKRVSDKTKMVVLTNPNNPTTVVYRRENLEKLSQFIIKHDLILVVDQAFEDIVFDGIEMVTVAALPGMWERTLTVCSLSKGIGLSGYRIGYIIADDKIMDKLYGATVTVLGATNTAAQIGAIEAVKDMDFIEKYKEIHLKRRDMVYDNLGDIKGIKLLKPESGFLSWIDVSQLGTESEVVDYLRKEAKVAINVGTPYGENGQGHIRVVHGVLGNDDELELALKRMRAAFIKLSKEKCIL